MSPILVRPVREQLEHDRIIRLLQAKFRRKYEVGINPGAEQNAPVGRGPSALYPDLVLSSLERGRRLQAVVEVETGESVNHLEALAAVGALRPGCARRFTCTCPAGMVDVARRLCEDNQMHVERDLELPHRRRPGAVHAGAPQPGGGRRPPRAGRRSRRRRGAESRPRLTRAARRKPAVRRAKSPAPPGWREEGRPAAEAQMKGGGGAVLRFSRDKRGYEHFYLVHQSNNRRGTVAVARCCTGSARRPA